MLRNNLNSHIIRNGIVCSLLVLLSPYGSGQSFNEDVAAFQKKLNVEFKDSDHSPLDKKGAETF